MLRIITRHLKRFKRGKHGVSNVIVVMLSLVILVIISANVILWSYQMNQLDWEKMNEDITITNVTRVTNSSWFVTQNEYTVSFGSCANGTYENTQTTNDGRWETFQENISSDSSFYATTSGGSGTNVQNVEGAPDDTYATLIVPPTQDAYGSGFSTGTEEICKVKIIAQYHVSKAASDDELTLKYSLDGGSTWGSTFNTTIPKSTVDRDWALDVTADRTWTWDDISALSVWLSYEKVKNSDGATVYADALWVQVQYGYKLDINSTYVIDVPTYPLDYIQTIEIQLRYKANDAGERWYLKAYNSTSSTYSDNGFNSTAGHTPTIGWNYYAVNLTDQWRSYAYNNGTLYVKLQDNQADSNQTTVDIDFLAVRVVIDGTKFTFKNEETLTSHLVSLWINNSTLHQRYDINVFINSADTTSYIRSDITLPNKPYTVKVVTERGNTAVFTSS